MDLRTVLSMLSVMVSAVSSTGLQAPGASSQSPPAAAASHVRNKRCSCATFLDKECVYFCHLDIIWVNTPERIVSYGLGNMPRKRRSVGVSAPTIPGPRCRCLRGRDSACSRFCRPDSQLRYDSNNNNNNNININNNNNNNKNSKKMTLMPSEVILRAEGGHGCAGARCRLAAAARIKRSSSRESAKTAASSSLALRVLDTWRTRRWRRTLEKEREEHVVS